MSAPSKFASDAVVAKTPIAGGQKARYLLIGCNGVPIWVDDPIAATSFPSMREATRMAVRLPAIERAFGLPRKVEVSAHTIH